MRLASNSPRKLLTVGHSYCVSLNRRLAHEMARAGKGRWEVTAVAPTFFHGDLRPITSKGFAGEECRLVKVPAYFTRSPHMFFYGTELREILSKGWDLVHCWEEPYVVAGAQVASWTPRSVPFVFWSGQTVDKRYVPPFSRFENYCVDRCAAWIGRGFCAHDNLAGKHNYSSKPHIELPLGVDTANFKPDPRLRATVMASLGWIDSGPPVIGFSGRFVEEKGLRLLTRAIDAQSSPWRALFVGGGRLESYLRRWADRHGDRVRIVTDVEHERVQQYLNAMDILCAPSQTTPRWREVFGRMVLEAFACGVPVIASDSGELPQVVGNAGLVVSESDQNAWTKEIGHLLNSPDSRSDLSILGCQRANLYAWPVVAQAHLNYFDRLLDAPRTTAATGDTSWPHHIPTTQMARKPLRRKRRLVSISHSYCVALNRRLAHEMSKQGSESWEVTAVAPSFFHGDLRPIWLEDLKDEMCEVESLNARFSRSPHLFFYSHRLREVLKDAWDLVHVWEEPYVLGGAEAAYFTPTKVPLVFWTAQNLQKTYPPPFSAFERYCVRRCAGWMAGGHSAADEMLKRQGYRGRPHRIMPLGVDLEAFRPALYAKHQAFQLLEWSAEGPPVVGFSGRFVEEKGLLLLLEALEKVASPWRAIFMGGGPLQPTLEHWSARYGDRVRIIANAVHHQVPIFLNAMDVLVAPSQTTPKWREQFGRMLIEAFACGVPVIASDSGEIPYVVGDAGIIVPERDVNSLAREIDGLIGDFSMRSEFASRGMARAHDKYAWPVIARAHLEFFSELV